MGSLGANLIEGCVGVIMLIVAIGIIVVALSGLLSFLT
jgi:hypothetical protein